MLSFRPSCSFASAGKPCAASMPKTNLYVVYGRRDIHNPYTRKSRFSSKSDVIIKFYEWRGTIKTASNARARRCQVGGCAVDNNNYWPRVPETLFALRLPRTWFKTFRPACFNTWDVWSLYQMWTKRAIDLFACGSFWEDVPPPVFKELCLSISGQFLWNNYEDFNILNLPEFVFKII